MRSFPAKGTVYARETLSISILHSQCAWICVQGLADSAPEEAIPALRGSLTEALKDVQQDQDRPRTFAAAEALSGLLASSSSYSGKRPSRDACIPACSVSAYCII